VAASMLSISRALMGVTFALTWFLVPSKNLVAESNIERARAAVGNYIRAGQFDRADKLLVKLIADGDAPSNYLRAVLIVKNKVAGDRDEIRRHLCAASETGYSRADTLLDKLDLRCEVTVPDQDKPQRDDAPASEEPKVSPKPEIASEWLKVAPQSGYKLRSGGSGVAVNGGGMFLTNHHVIEGCSNSTVVYQQLRGEAKVIMASEALDLALLRVEAPTPYFAKFDENDYALGEKLYAAGYPLSNQLGDDLKFSQGILMSSRDDQRGIIDKGYLVTDITIGNGSSGGPVLSEEGLLRGLVSQFWVIGEEVEWTKNGRMSENLSVMVSGLEILNQLRSFNKQIPQIYSGTRRTLRSRDIAKLAEQITVRVECIVYD